MILLKERLDCSNLVVRNDGSLQTGPQSEQRDPSGILLVVVDVVGSAAAITLKSAPISIPIDR